MEEEATRIQPLHHGHHRTAKQPKPELPSPVEAASKPEKIPRQLGKSQATAKDARKARKMA